MLRAPAGLDGWRAIALAGALLDAVAAGQAPETALLYRSAPAVSFGRLDRRLPGFDAARSAALRHGFAPVLRVVGGQAAAMHAGTVVLAHAVPHPAPREDTQERYELALRVLERALEALGVATERGELPGEWCPGRHSLHAGPRKLAGVAQRVRMRAALTEALVIAADPAPLRAVLADVHEALGVGFAPETVGAVAELAAADTDAVEAALVAALAQERALEPAEPDPALLAAAAELRPRHDLGA